MSCVNQFYSEIWAVKQPNADIDEFLSWVLAHSLSAITVDQSQ